MSGRYLKLDGVDYRLASWLSLDEQYQDIYLPLDPSLRFLPNRSDGLVADEGSTYWSVKDWDGGEGFPVWDPEQAGFRKATNLRRLPGSQKGLELGPRVSTTQFDAAGGDMTDGRRFGYGEGTLWVGTDTDAYRWNFFTDDWYAPWTTGASATQNITSFADGQNGYMFTGHSDGRIWRFNFSTQTAWFSTFTEHALIVAFGSRIFALDGSDLYEIDKSTVDTRTLVVDAQGESDLYFSSAPWCYRRLAVSDKGPIWLQRLDTGETFVWEYNVAQEVGAIVGKLPVSFAFPYSIMYANGFIFVGFRNAYDHDAFGDAYIYYQRGAQRGVLGPIRSSNGSTLSQPVFLAGLDGSDLLFYFDDLVWAYSLSSGGVFAVAERASTGAITDAAVFGESTFIANPNDAVERFDGSKHTLNTGRIESGVYDLSYFDIPKLILEVTVFTDPLPANTSLTLEYSLDGAAFAATSVTKDTDGDTVHSFTLSTSSSSQRARLFEYAVELDTTDETATPTLRGVLVRAISGTHERRIVLAIDCSTDDSGEQDAETVVSNLRTLAAKDEIVSLSMPFEKREGETPETLDVSVRTVRIPSIDRDKPTAVVELQAAGLTS